MVEARHSECPAYFWPGLQFPGVALTQLYAHIAHKNPAVRKIMEAMRSAFAEKRDNTLNTLDYFERKGIVCEQHFIPLNRWTNPVVRRAFEMRQSFPYFFFRW